MRAILISLLVIGVCGCGSDDAGTPKQPVSTPTAEKPVDDPTPAAKMPDVATPLPDVATVKKTLTPAQLAVGDPIENSIDMVLVPIPAGEFYMGSPELEKFRENDETRHRVKLMKSFHLGRTEVTQAQWEAVMGTTPWKDLPKDVPYLSKQSEKEGDNYPAVWVTWDDAVEFCEKLSEREGEEYRLPTEAEWEYACRAGTTTAYSFGDDEAQLGEYAWYDKNFTDVGADEEYAHIVGQKKRNPWGLHDMHGNVWEWVQDRHGEYPSGDVTDPVGPASGAGRVYRGGGWFNFFWSCRSAIRPGYPPSLRKIFLGFRVLRSSAK